MFSINFGISRYIMFVDGTIFRYSVVFAAWLCARVDVNGGNNRVYCTVL